MIPVISLDIDKEQKRFRDLNKTLDRRRHRQDYECGGEALPYMKRFAKKLLPCPVCGETPTVAVVRCMNDDSRVDIKMFCVTMHASEILIDCGDWHETLAKAGRSWNARVRGEDVDGRLHRIGCGRGW